MSFPIQPVPQQTDYLVIGSGFGGSVMTEALAAAGREVCLLERGNAYPPGSFPRTPDGVATNFWDPSKGLHGMFDVWSFDRVAAVVSSGLGGGSLIYANVMLEKPDDWFTQPSPDGAGDETWSFGGHELAKHYRKVTRFLGVQTLPAELVGAHSPKTARFLDASGGAYAPLAVRFRDGSGTAAVGAPLPAAPYGSLFGAPRRTTCRLIGECDVGCNEGAKSSMDHTYLSKAFHDGASIHVRTEVETIRRILPPPADGYLFEVDYVGHGDGGLRTNGSIRAKRVVLAAGSLGTTYLMLRNREQLGVPDESPLGTRFCGNGDLLGLAEPEDDDVNYEASRGPVITAYEEDHDDVRMVLQDGGVPTIALWLLKTFDAPGVLGRAFKEVADEMWARIVGSKDDNLSAELSWILGRSPRVARSLPMLAMGADVPDGTLSLDADGLLENDWTPATSAAYFAGVRRRMNAVRQRMGAHLRPEPAGQVSQVITVHPLGGCPADTSRSAGVVDSCGRVRGVDGLWIADGSVFPGPAGVNPSLTIAAFASRAAEHLLCDDPAGPPAQAAPWAEG